MDTRARRATLQGQGIANPKRPLNVTIMTKHTNWFIMVTMKHYIVVITAIMFLANAYVASAWAMPHVNINAPSSATEMANKTDMPCHAKQDKQKSPTKHCEGICLCFHVSINQTPILNNQASLIIPLNQFERLTINNERIASMATAPPRRPPKVRA